MNGFNRGGIGLGLLLVAAAVSANAQVNVTQFHNHITRDGLYVDPDFTVGAAAAVTRDLSFNGTISGNVRAQPLYISGTSGGPPMIIAVTESDNVYALNATNGTVIWKDSAGSEVTTGLDCSDSINPLGITGTPVVDLPSRALFFNALTTTNGGASVEHLIYSVNVDTGATNSGWPVNLNLKASSNGTNFQSFAQTQLNALSVLNGYVYVAYCGCGDTGTYYGWLVGVQISNPANVLAWAVGSRGGGSWGVGGAASDDGIHPIIGTGNSYNPATWTGGEAIIRFEPGPVFSGLTNDYWLPTNWQTLDTDDNDLGSSGPLVMDVPGASPSALVVALGKDGNGYLLNRNNLGGMSLPLAQKTLSMCNIDQAAAAYQTSLGTYFVCNVSTTSTSTANETQLLAVRISATSPPTMTTTWTNNENGRASPFVTSTDGTNNVVVWGMGSSGGDGRLHGFNADTGAVIYGGGGANELMSGVEKWNTAIAANGRIYVAADNKVYAFNTAAAAAQLAFSTPPASAIAGQEIGGTGTGFTVQLEDADGNPLSGAGTNITVSLGSGTGTLTGTLTVATGSGGSATFNVTNTTPGAETITASSGSLTPATSSSFNINAGPAAQLAVVQMPATVLSGNVVSPYITVQVEDAVGNALATNGVSISLVLASGAATLSGTTTAVTGANGLATFSNLIITGNGNVTVTASAGGLPSVTSQSFMVAVANIPTVSEWGLLGMVVLQLMVGALFLLRRNRTAAPAQDT